jgi:group II intron reverse transcriptase/maturase
VVVHLLYEFGHHKKTNISLIFFITIINIAIADDIANIEKMESEYRDYLWISKIAVESVKERCWQRAWVLDMDIKGFFDAIDHQLLMKAVDKHVKEDWHRLYIRRWLQASVLHPDGHLEQKTQGTPQGGVISPLLANLFLHYAFDQWLTKHHPDVQFARYADDIVCHCRTEQEAITLLAVLKERFVSCGLLLHPEKTKIVYCKSWKNKADYAQISFDFLGFTFRPRLTKCRDGILLVCFLPAVRHVKDSVFLMNNNISHHLVDVSPVLHPKFVYVHHHSTDSTA